MRVRHRLRLIGRCAPRLRMHLEVLARRRGVELDLDRVVADRSWRADAVLAAANVRTSFR